ncbi:MAG: carbamate kinase [Deltaproteobacteria bacterium RIFOXYA12_FULL_61_11]|nr:MAG: carbamate kinase [Deltaproteobacteria bacterium RIFOXYA12_FULL_61_11]
MTKETIIVALGGNAITREAEESSIAAQFANTRKSLNGALDLIEQGHRVVITHGNGPQVGNYMIRVEASRTLAPPLPLGIMVADLQGGMGYMIAQTMINFFLQRSIKRNVATVLTQVVVDRNDPTMLNPTKFVGLAYKKDDVEELRRERHWVMKEDIGRGWRRVVPSPTPLEIVEKDVIRGLCERGDVIIAAGGGGIPVYRNEQGLLDGVDAVIDKDLASAVLARDIGAERLIILTAVDQVCLGFTKPNQRSLPRLSLEQARQYLAEGEFPAGSMGPKIKACINFLEWGGKEALITSVERFTDALAGKTGTRITVD